MNFPTGFTEWTRTPPSKPGVYVWVHSLPEVKKAVPVAQSAIRYPEIRVGSYTLSPRLGGKIWLQHTSGEGMMTDAAKLEKHLTAFWNKEF